jgi:hypothetical protein
MSEITLPYTQIFFPLHPEARTSALSGRRSYIDAENIKKSAFFTNYASGLFTGPVSGLAAPAYRGSGPYFCQVTGHRSPGENWTGVRDKSR